MHELSIATNLVDVATEAAADAGGGRIVALQVRLGACSSVVVEALEFAWEAARDGTACDGARLEVERVAARAMCDACGHNFELEDPYTWRCPRCTAIVVCVAGRELELHAIELDEAETMKAEKS